MSPARRKKKAAQAASRGLDARRLGSAEAPAAMAKLADRIEKAQGAVLATYRDPLGGHWQVLAALPVDRVAPTPFQRDLSEPHVERMAKAIDKLDRYLDPIVAVPAPLPLPEGGPDFWTPNGNHRLGAMRQLGARAIVALVVPDIEVAHRILLLNTEKAHNLRERALEVARLAEGLAALDDRPEKDYAAEFEEAPLITLGLCYQLNGRFAGGAYHGVLKRCDKFLGTKLSRAIEVRRERAQRLIELNEAVGEAIAALKSRGFESPYLRAFVVARINPLRFQRRAVADFDETIGKMIASAKRFDAGKVRADQVARSGGAPDESS